MPVNWPRKFWPTIEVVFRAEDVPFLAGALPRQDYELEAVFYRVDADGVMTIAPAYWGRKPHLLEELRGSVSMSRAKLARTTGIPIKRLDAVEEHVKPMRDEDMVTRLLEAAKTDPAASVPP